MYVETRENKTIKQDDAISTRELVLLTETNMNADTPNDANRTSEKLKCSIVRKDKLFV